MYNVQSLETLGRLQEVKGNVRSVIEKLKGIKADLVRDEENWQEWDFTQLLVALRKWKNPSLNLCDCVKNGALNRAFATISQPRSKIWKNCKRCSFIIARVLSNKTNLIFISCSL